MITGKILRVEESTDGRKNLKIMVEFREDGVVIVPEWTLWAQFQNFIGMTQAQISEWIRINIESQIGNLIKERAKTPINSALMTTIGNLKSVAYETDKVEIEQPVSIINPVAYTIVLNADGTWSKK